jgi:outer membrane protein OmpA-like peptidoglycan-associated protein
MRCLFIAILLFPLVLHSQNLLMNSGFEDENICTEYIKNCAPEGWISTSLQSDYFFLDPPNAYEGEHFIGLYVSFGYYRGLPKPHNYIRSRLLCRLRKDSKYKLEFYVRGSPETIDSAGIFFSADDILYSKAPAKAIDPDLLIKNGVTSKTKDWQKVSLTYTARGDENFIVLGDFKKEMHRFSKNPDLKNDFYFFIDDISLVPLNTHERLCADAAKVKEEEYDFNERHGMLQKKIYYYRKTPPPLEHSEPTVLQRIDTLVIPDVLFAVNSYSLSNKAYTVLDSFIRKTKNLPIDSLIIEGHTDNTGKASANMILSKNRSQVVYEYIQAYFPSPIITRYWGGQKPVADNKTMWGKQKNRRVEIYLYVRE